MVLSLNLYIFFLLMGFEIKLKKYWRKLVSIVRYIYKDYKWLYLSWKELCFYGEAWRTIKLDSGINRGTN